VIATALHGYFVRGIARDEEGCDAHEQERAASSGVFEWFGGMFRRRGCSS